MLGVFALPISNSYKSDMNIDVCKATLFEKNNLDNSTEIVHNVSLSSRKELLQNSTYDICTQTSFTQ